MVDAGSIEQKQVSMQSRKSEKKDPIRELPLREPGETLQERIVDEAMGAWFMWAFLAAVIGGVALKEWVHLLAQTEPQPYIFTVAAVVLATISFWQWQRSKNRIVRYRKGLKGERHVGQFLQSQLIPMGYHILHDIECDGCNIDHVAIGPGGVFAIEVKTYFKRPGDARISYDGDEILVDGQRPLRDPLAQVRASSRQLADLLEKRTGRNVEVRPVVLFPGWFVEKMPLGADTWVLPETAFVKFIQKQTPQLSDGDSKVLFEGLVRHVRDRLTNDGYTP